MANGNPFVPAVGQFFGPQRPAAPTARDILGPFARTQIAADQFPGLLRGVQAAGVVDDIALNNLLATTLGSQLSKDIGDIVADPTGANQGRGSSGFIDSITRLAALNDQVQSKRSQEVLQAGQLAASMVPNFQFQRTQSQDPRFVDFGDPNAGVGQALTQLAQFGATQQGQQGARERQEQAGPSRVEQLLEAVLAQTGQVQPQAVPVPPGAKVKPTPAKGNKVVEVVNDEGTDTVFVEVDATTGETTDPSAPASVPRKAGSAAEVEVGIEEAVETLGTPLVESPAGSKFVDDRVKKLIQDMVFATDPDLAKLTPNQRRRLRESGFARAFSRTIGGEAESQSVVDRARTKAGNLSRKVLARGRDQLGPALGSDAVANNPELRDLIEAAQKAGFDFDAARQTGTPASTDKPFLEIGRGASPEESRAILAFANAVRRGEVDEEVVLGLVTNPATRGKPFRFALTGDTQTIDPGLAVEIVKAVRAQNAAGTGFVPISLPPG